MTGIEQVENAFYKFNKWESYAIAFDLMDKRRVTLREIAAVARQHGISKRIVEMRRSQYLAHMRFYNDPEA